MSQNIKLKYFHKINNYPCLCLKRGFFLLITNKTPLRLTILQSTLLFLIEALTFILFIFNSFSTKIMPYLNF